MGRITATLTAALLAAGGLVGVAAPATAVAPAFTPLAPARIMDTRPDGTTVDGLAAGTGPVLGGSVRTLPVLGRGGVPATGAVAVVLNVTVTAPSAASFITVFPCGAPRPNASNLNFVAGQTVPNSVTVALGAGGTVCVYNHAGAAEVVVDLAGWFADTPDFTPLVPARVMDTRTDGTTVDGLALGGGPIRAGETRHLPIVLVSGGRGGVPDAGAAAVAVNVTVTGASAASFLTVWPCDATRPNASNLNFVAGQTVPNAAVVRLDPGGTVCVYNHAGAAQVIVDVSGSFAIGSAYASLAPARIMDTRADGATVDGFGRDRGTIGDGEQRVLAVAGRGGIAATGVGSVVVNVTVVGPTAPSFLSVYPCGTPRPNASNLNFTAGQIVPNLAVVKLGDAGTLCVYNHSGAVDVVVDVSGSFAGAFPPAPAFTQLDAGGAHACGVTAAGAAYCWGENTDGQVGDGEYDPTGRTSLPVLVVGLEHGVTRISAGDYATCAVQAGALLCWGVNTVIGLDSPVPEPVTGLESGVTDVSVGYEHVCAVRAGAALCWGAGEEGQLGNGLDGAGANSATPVAVTGLTSGVTRVGAGDAHSCALRAGEVLCWGARDAGQVGDGVLSPPPPVGTNRTTPTTVIGLGSGVTDLSVGANHTCAATLGVARCWGRNLGGAVGLDPAIDASATPVAVAPVGEDPIVTVAAGWNASCARTDLGYVQCWGSNDQGQLVDPEAPGGPDPAVFFPPIAAVGLSIGSGLDGFACILHADGTYSCWGANSAGQLGQGTTATFV